MNNSFDFPINPRELKIEITRACNLRCSFCYLGVPERWLDNDYHMPEDEVFKWIDWAVDNNIPGIRFTGGEAVLHPQIEMFCNYAHLRKRYVILNTNGMADPALYDSLLVDDLRVSMPTLDPEHMDKLTSGTDVLARKLELIKRTLAAGTKHVVILTVLTPELIGKLEDFAVLVQSMPGLHWGPLRYESSPDNHRPISREQMQRIAEEVDVLMQRYPKQVIGIITASPFCSVSPRSLGARVFLGATTTCGPYAALNVNFNSTLTACFGICELFKEGTLEDVINNPKFRARFSLARLPQECQACEYVQRCAGGCSRRAGLTEHNGKLVDYLAGFVTEAKTV